MARVGDYRIMRLFDGYGWGNANSFDGHSQPKKANVEFFVVVHLMQKNQGQLSLR